MTDVRPRPWAGALLGLILGLVVVALLWLLGILPPDRLVLFGIVAVTVAGSMAACTQRLSAARASSITVIVLASLLGGVALTGIPEAVRGGSLSQGCALDATSAQETAPVGLADTSALDPFDVSTTDTVEWTGAFPAAAVQVQVEAGLEVGGFAIPLHETEIAVVEGADAWAGSIDVAAVLADIKDRYGIDLTGTFHLTVAAEAPGGVCAGEGYVRVLAPSAVGGVMLAALWAALAVLVVAILVLAVVVRRSFAIADEDYRTAIGEPLPDYTLGTGGPISQEPVDATVAPPSPSPHPEAAPRPNGSMPQPAPAPAPAPEETGEAGADGAAPGVDDPDAPDQEGDQDRGAGI